MSNLNREIIVLPHISIGEELGLGKFVLFSSGETTRIPKKYRKQVERFSKLYSSINGMILDVGILSRDYGRSKLAVLDDEERLYVRKIIDALAFSACFPQRDMGPARDNFTFTAWKFFADKSSFDSIHISNRRFQFNIVNYEPGLVKIPLHVHRAKLQLLTAQETLLSAFIGIVESDSPDASRIMHAINWFNLAHSDTPDMTDFTRLSLTATAFEALLNTPRQGITNYFVNSVQLLLGENELIAKWAREFYSARSDIVHGSSLPNLKFGKYSHHSMLALADLVFFQCVVRLLKTLDYFPMGAKDYLLRDNVVKYLTSNKERLKFIAKYQLDSDRSESRSMWHYLHTIQERDSSLEIVDCNSGLRKLLRLAKKGVTRLKRNPEFRTAGRLRVLDSYRLAFNNIQEELNNNLPINVYKFMQAVQEPGDDTWDNARVQGEPIEQDGLVTISALGNAIDTLSEIRTRLMHA